MPATKRNAAGKKRGQAPLSVGQRARRWLRKHRGWFVSVAVIGAVIGGIIYFADPFASSTAIDADGNKVETGVLKTEGAAPREGRHAPNFLLADYDGKAVRLDEFRGKTVLLNWWATWCTVCEQEMPDMQRLASENPNDFVIVAINRGEGRRSAQSWSDARGLTALRFVLDSQEDIARAYKLPSGMPNSFFVDKDGIVRVVKHGGMRYAEMKQLLEETRASAARN